MLKFPNKSKPKGISEQIKKIEILARSLSHVPLTDKQRQYIFHKQLLKSALFSAKIEGNELKLSELKGLDLNESKSKREVSNVLKARKLVESYKKIDVKKVKNVHRAVMNSLMRSVGSFRAEPGTIYDKSGNVVYISPLPEDMKKMLEIWIKEINKDEVTLLEQVDNLVRCHYYFEKIHPFLDGNGRVGRVLMQWQIGRISLLSQISLPIEEFLEENKIKYYRLLDKNRIKIDEFVQFIAQGLVWSLEKVLSDIEGLADRQESESEYQLLPRRQEILNIITDHPFCSRDFIWRRFPSLSKRMIAYDLRSLLDKRLVVKHGKTKGSVYSKLK